MQLSIAWILISCFIAMTRGQDLSSLSGEDIVALMQTMGDKCPSTAANGQNWAPLPKDATCAGVKRCDFPNQWCVFKANADGTPVLESLNCQPVSDSCKKGITDLIPGAGGATGGSTAGSEATTAASDATSPAATEATSPAAETTAATSPAAESSPEATTESTATESSPVATEATSAPAASETAATETTSPAGGGETTASPTGNATGECCDYHEYCCFWAATGECNTNKAFMLPICQKSCGSCGCNGNPDSCTVNVDSKCSGADAKPGDACPCNSDHLVNRDWNPKCGAWAAKGDCDTNPKYMKAMCKMSCHICQ